MTEQVRVLVGGLSEGQSRGFSVVWQGEALEGFLVYRDGDYYAYRNRCPHTGAPLDWTPDQFLDLEGRFIQCALHGALFQVEDGLCIHGPCVSRHLERLPIVQRDDGIWLA